MWAAFLFWHDSAKKQADFLFTLANCRVLDYDCLWDDRATSTAQVTTPEKRQVVTFCGMSWHRPRSVSVVCKMSAAAGCVGVCLCVL